MARPLGHREQEVGGAEARYLLFLVRAGEILGLSLDYHETLRNVCAAAVETVADICLLDLGSGNDIDLVAAAHRVPGMSSRLVGAGEFLRQQGGFARHAVCEVIDTGTPVLVESLDDAAMRKLSTSNEHAQFMRDLGYRSMIVVPVVSNVQGILGALTLVRAYPSEEQYDERALLFAEDLGRRCGVAISKSKLYSQSIEVATRLQVASLPRTLPSVPHAALDAYYEPAEAELLIGGDWYDAFTLRDGRIGISIGDVTGHGVDAAAFMRSLRDALRTALYGKTDLLHALDIADYLIAEEFPEGRYATAQLSIYDPRTRMLSGASAGHPGPLIWTPASSEVFDAFPERGLPLGLRALQRIEQQTCEVVLDPGALAVFFTDGLVEWSCDYVQGEAALRRAIADAQVRRSPNPAKALRRAVVRGKHQDDIALLTLRVEE
ncbi:MAG TPA: GAF domain-containing SpoIIE family protein phosphatase [Candidatus Baltobacteraceae bacterium]|nr:GAF domain-containing SpoIIE family protein phosphatase [Candidatus Baltobacteraceae bacterium]